ncbi:helix-turn-helix transcriptional regulator [Olsenella sp. YH-ols2221]|uniref:helix-turn-helix domain-containing protein n=1 Tax=Olsenella kribbiana TaxID=3115221 RepID=UPI002ED9A8D8
MENRIRELREARNLTRRLLADCAHVGYDALAKWEEGENEIALDKAISIAKTLYCKLSNLVYTAPKHDYQLDRLCRNYRDMSDEGKQALAATNDALLSVFENRATGVAPLTHPIRIQFRMMFLIFGHRP